MVGHIFEIDDDEYTQLEQVARQQGSTAETLFRAWMKSVTTTEAREVRSARARWAALSPSVELPTDEDLRTHPLLRVVGIGAMHEPGWADRHDAVFGGAEEREEHDDE